MNKLFCFGLGFTGENVANYFIQHNWQVYGTIRKERSLNPNITVLKYDPQAKLNDLKDYLSETDILLISIAPDGMGDVVLNNNFDDITVLLKNGIKRVIYLSTTAVYGDAEGKEIDENFPVNPNSQRARNRIKAERQWINLCKEYGIPCNVLRLSGIYGRGRNQIKNLLNGNAKRIIKKGQIFNRIHVEDITNIVFALSNSRLASEVFNVSDDLPSPPQDVVEYAADLLSVTPPDAISFENAKLSNMAKSFYSETKRIKNTKIKNILNIQLKYSSYKQGLEEIVNLKNNKTKFGILQVAPSIDSGGAEQTCIEIGRELNINGFVSYLASSGGRLKGEYEKGGNIHINFPLNSKNPLIIIMNIVSLIYTIKKYNISLVHARSRAPAISAYFASKLMKVHFLTTYHGIYSEKSLFKRKYNQFMVRGQLTIANSNYTKQIIQERYALPDNQISIIHRGVDTEKFNIKSIKSNYIDQIRKEYFLENSKIILLPGRVTKWKGHELAIEAFRKLNSNSNLSLKLIFAGENKKHESHTKKLKKLIVDYGLENDIKFLGHIKDIPSIMYLSDIVLCPSVEPEAFGRVIAESLAMGKIVIASDIGPVREIINKNDEDDPDNYNGYLFKSGDSNDLHKKIEKALNLNPKQIQNLSLRAVDSIIEKFTIKKMCEKTIRIYASLLNKNVR